MRKFLLVHAEHLGSRCLSMQRRISSRAASNAVGLLMSAASHDAWRARCELAVRCCGHPVLCCCVWSRAADPKLEARGKAVLQEKCAHCNSIDAVGDSPLRIAPPMREICGRYLVRELHAELLEGKVSKYKEMPQVDFSPEDVDAILAYLYSLVAK